MRYNDRNYDPGKNNPFVQLIRQAEFIWNEYKGLAYDRDSKKKKQIEKLKKLIADLKKIDFESEFKFLEYNS